MASTSSASALPRFAREADAGFPTRLQPSFAHHLASGTWPVERVKDLQLSLHSTPAAPTIARSWARDFFSQRLSATQLDDTLLMLTELVTNAVRHAIATSGGFVDVHLAIAPRRLRVEVHDVGDGFALPVANTDALHAGGYGLLIVDSASSRWGRSDASPHCVWFELDRDLLG
jgi:anti-sigma regulatory factor (Ser/Thr protein kinase)